MKALRNITLPATIFTLTLFALISCKGALEKPSSENKAETKGYLKITVATELGRSVLPVADITTFKNFVLKMQSEDDKSENTYSFADYDSLVSSTIGVETGSWTFTLSSGDFAGTCSKTINSGNNSLSFTLVYKGTSATGDVEVLIELPDDERIKLIKCGLFKQTTAEAEVYAVEELELTRENNKINAKYSKEDITSGYYLIKWFFYGDTAGKILLDSKKELLLVESGFLSKKTINFTSPLAVYNITYNLNGGSFAEGFTSPVSYSAMSDFDLPKEDNVLNEGKFFEGWYTTEDFTGNKLSFVKTGTTGNLTLYAKWKNADVNIVSLTDSSDDLEDYNLIEIEANQSVQELWYLKPCYTYYGKWIDFNTNTETLLSGNGYSTIDATLKIYSENDELIKQIDDEDSFNFTVNNEGYYKVVVSSADANGCCAYLFYKKGVTYDIQYELKGGTFDDSKYSYLYNFSDTYSSLEEKYLADSIYLTKTNCIFTGWYETEECNTEPVKRIPAGSYGDKTFYAGWQKELVIITFVTDYVTAPAASYIGKGNTVSSGTLPTLSYEGYAFKGWMDSENHLIAAENYTVSADITLTAIWVQLCNVSFISSFGTVPSSIPVEKGQKIAASQLPRPTATGKYFMGWYKSSTYESDTKVSVGKTTISSDITLYAKWGNTSEVADGFVFVEGGTVKGNDDYNHYNSGAFPKDRTVTLSDFYISDHEVTQGEYEKYCSYTSSKPASSTGLGVDYPAYYTSWYDAIVYCNLKSMADNLTPCYSLSGETDPKKWTGIKNSNGKYCCSYTSSNSTWNSITCDMTANGYRLPTEAEWEYAARGGQKTYGTNEFAYYFAGATTTNYNANSNGDLIEVGWYTSNSESKVHEIKQKQPNALGLYDMSGNVSEWCWDWYNSSVGTDSVTNPCGASSGSYRILRGGSRNSYAYGCAVSIRSNINPYSHNNAYGFRLVSNAPTSFYTVTYSSEKGTAPESQKTRVITASLLPELSEIGWVFEGWYFDASFTQMVAAGYALTKSETLYAKWEKYNDNFILVEGGTVVGSNDYNNSYTGAFPAGRTVTLSSFYMSDHEVTQGEYEKYCCYTSNSPTSTYGKGTNYPAYGVSWYDAIVYCNLKSMAVGLNPCYSLSGEKDPKKWTGIKTSNGKYSCSYIETSTNWNSITCDMTANGYRLPTEAEWEYAARGGKITYGTPIFANYFAGANTTNYSANSNSDLDSVGWYYYNICNNGVTGSTPSNTTDAGYGTHEVKQKTPNALGLYDMSGNVHEMCWDWYSDSVGTGTEVNPRSASSGSRIVVRGGCWSNEAFRCAVSYRGYNYAYISSAAYGIRLVRSCTTDIYDVDYVTTHGTAPESTKVRTAFSSENLPDLTESGWTFLGWYTSSSYSENTKASVGQHVTKNLTLYAKWNYNDGFVFVEGETVVGSNNYNQNENNIGAFPEGRAVTLSSFYISDHEVTQGEYETYCCYTSDTPSSDYGKGSDYPAYYVSWYDAIVYCNLRSIAKGLTPCYSLSGETDPKKWDGINNSNGKYSCRYIGSNSDWDSITCNMTANGYRLPTEAEWEYAARGGQKTYGTDKFAYYFAGATTEDFLLNINNDLNPVAWYDYNSSKKSHEIKTKSPNALDLYDMSGNVWEWCWDWYSDSVDKGSVTDPCGPLNGKSRIVRGGGWGFYAKCSSVSFRSGSFPGTHDYSISGLRLVRSAE